MREVLMIVKLRRGLIFAGLVNNSADGLYICDSLRNICATVRALISLVLLPINILK
jgi:hypothetical protein